MSILLKVSPAHNLFRSVLPTVDPTTPHPLALALLTSAGIITITLSSFITVLGL